MRRSIFSSRRHASTSREVLPDVLEATAEADRVVGRRRRAVERDRDRRDARAHEALGRAHAEEEAVGQQVRDVRLGAARQRIASSTSKRIGAVSDSPPCTNAKYVAEGRDRRAGASSTAGVIVRAAPLFVSSGACVMQCAQRRLQRSVTEKKKPRRTRLERSAPVDELGVAQREVPARARRRDRPARARARDRATSAPNGGRRHDRASDLARAGRREPS